MKNKIPESVDVYIAGFPEEVQHHLKQIRAAVKKAAPGATEKISYSMPYYALSGRLLYFAAFKHHIGFYPMASGITAFKKELSIYKGAKGSVQFPLDKPMPLSLITKIVQFRVRENLTKAGLKK
jgi:uncharacterized protein YdhG (YjbR/CyaY superfamily)